MKLLQFFFGSNHRYAGLVTLTFGRDQDVKLKSSEGQLDQVPAQEQLKLNHHTQIKY